MTDINKINNLVHVGTKYVFTRMQNIIWVTNGLSLAYLIEKDAGDLLGRIIREANLDKTLIVNFCRITDIDDHALDGFFDECLITNRQVIILNGNHLFAKIDSLRKGKSIQTTNDPLRNVIIIGNNSVFDFDISEKERLVVVKDYTDNVVKNSFEKFPTVRRLNSTPLIASGEFNSNKLISDIKTFMWLSTFMSDKLSDIISEYKISNVKLLSASLRGAPFAASIGLTLNLPFDTIDHLGPKHKVFDKDFITKIEKGTNYIFVGDFCVGGTEIKNAKTYTGLKGSFLNHAIVIGNYIEPEHFKSDFMLFSLINLRELGIVNYSI